MSYEQGDLVLSVFFLVPATAHKIKKILEAEFD